MKTTRRNALTIALAIAVMSPATWASRNPPAQGAAERAQERVPANEGMRMNPSQRTEQTSTPPPPPPQSQGQQQAAEHSSVVQRDLWARLDSNGDGQISRGEAAADAEFKAEFTTLDADSDGYITAGEYQTAAKEEIGAGPGSAGANAAAHSTAATRDLMSRLDANGDGSISAGESGGDANFESSFSTIDANSDGMVTGDEYRSWLQSQRK